MIMLVETIGKATIYCGDCAEVMSTFSSPEINAVISDPPYGNGYQVNKERPRVAGLDWGSKPPENHKAEWVGCNDDKPFDPLPWLDFPEVILWGANHFASRLPDASKWLVWNKLCGKTPTNFSDCELAYTNLPGSVKIFDHLWRGLVRAGEENIINGPKVHPWQKPLALMRWCVSMTEGLVLDPYMGSGTTGVACLDLGREFIGIEIEEHYFEIACERLAEAQTKQSQGSLF